MNPFSTHRCMCTEVCRPFKRFITKLAQWNIVCSVLRLFSVCLYREVPLFKRNYFLIFYTRTILAICVLKALRYRVIPTPIKVPLPTGLVKRLSTKKKKKVVYIVQLLYLMGLYRNSIDAGPSTVKENIFSCLATVLLACMNRWFSRTLLSPMKNIFSFLSKILLHET